MLLYIKTGWSIIGIFQHVGLQVPVVLSCLSCRFNCIIHIRSAVTWAFLTRATSVWEANGFHPMTQPGATIMFWDIGLADNWYEGHDSQLHLLVIVIESDSECRYIFTSYGWDLISANMFLCGSAQWLCLQGANSHSPVAGERNAPRFVHEVWITCICWSCMMKNTRFEDISYFHSATCGNVKLHYHVRIHSSIAPDPVCL